jgi:hypothetical protein
MRRLLRDSALYFPYIDIPQEQWVWRILLYWDRLKSIVPSEYVHKPALHSRFMQELRDSGLVEPVMPGRVARGVDLAAHFIPYVTARLAAHPISSNGQRVRIHIEKLGDLGDQLVDLRLATRDGDPWFMVDHWVAAAFMTFLAQFLGALPKVNAAPITPDPTLFALLSDNTRDIAEIAETRQVILQRVMPLPKGPVTLKQVLKFRRQYGDLLCGLRRMVELECLELIRISDPELRSARKRKLVSELETRAREIDKAMRPSWLTKFASIAAVGSTIAGGIGGGPSGAAAIGLGLSGLAAGALHARLAQRGSPVDPLAFGALARRSFAQKRRLRVS